MSKNPVNPAEEGAKEPLAEATPASSSLKPEQAALLRTIEAEPKTGEAVTKTVTGVSEAAKEVTKIEQHTVETTVEAFELAAILNAIGKDLVGKDKMKEIDDKNRLILEEELRTELKIVSDFLNALRVAIESLPESGAVAADSAVNAVYDQFIGQIQKQKGPIAQLFRNIAKEDVVKLAQSLITNPALTTQEAVGGSSIYTGLGESVTTQQKQAMKKSLTTMLDVMRAISKGFSKNGLKGLATEVSNSNLTDKEQVKTELDRINGEKSAAYILIGDKALFCYDKRGWDDAKKLLDQGYTALSLRIIRTNETVALLNDAKNNQMTFATVRVADGSTSTGFSFTKEGSVNATFLKKAGAPDSDTFMKNPLVYIGAPLSDLTKNV